MFGFLKARTQGEPLDGGDPWKGRLAFGAIVLVAAYFTVQLIVGLQTLWLLIFGAIVVAVVLRSLADPIVRWLRLPDPMAVFASLLIVVLFIAGVLFLFGTQIAQQIASLSAVLPQGAARVQAYVLAQPYGPQLLEQVQHLGDRAGQALQVAQKFAMGFASGLTTLLLVVVAGVFLAIEPAKSREGMLSIFPMDRRPRLRQVLNTCGMALKGWLKAQLFSMVLVGTLTGVGLAVIGVPSALALGLLTGLAQFVPIVGPIVSTVPAVLVATTQGLDTVLLTLGLYLVVSQLESNFITPMVQKNVANLPVVLGIFAVVGIGTLFGPLGVLFATPLALVLHTLVTMLYRQDVLGDPDAKAHGEKGRKSKKE
ncbi:AI-2E family transporter [Brevundimonas sp. PAMC22021]|uniref:AI-2E family transporter n=1 Tax=Brevundimonas sp. PAMC22021 TaxID=2861285 RepID=UPI001C626AD3|nr:AI-2E family transporter [Brevundimonas sp. PAMC22021]QYF87637.1 AI-2E family transporter [Brevundimonas sp. PAMC22021]